MKNRSANQKQAVGNTKRSMRNVKCAQYRLGLPSVSKFGNYHIPHKIVSCHQKLMLQQHICVQGSPTNSPQTDEASWTGSETFQPNKKEVQLPQLNFQITSLG